MFIIIILCRIKLETIALSHNDNKQQTKLESVLQNYNTMKYTYEAGQWCSMQALTIAAMLQQIYQRWCQCRSIVGIINMKTYDPWTTCTQDKCHSICSFLFIFLKSTCDEQQAIGNRLQAIAIGNYQQAGTEEKDSNQLQMNIFSTHFQVHLVILASKVNY